MVISFAHRVKKTAELRSFSWLSGNNIVKYFHSTCYPNYCQFLERTVNTAWLPGVISSSILIGHKKKAWPLKLHSLVYCWVWQPWGKLESFFVNLGRQNQFHVFCQRKLGGQNVIHNDRNVHLLSALKILIPIWPPYLLLLAW